MKETEKRLALEINQAKLEARDERDEELRSDIAGWEERTQKAVHDAEERHKHILLKSGEEQEMNTNILRSQLKEEKEEAILYAEKALKEQLSEEWMERMKGEVDNAWNQASVQSKAKLVKQQQALEEFKRDVTIQSQRHATELQERLQLAEEDLTKVETTKNKEMEQIMSNLRSEIELSSNAKDEAHAIEISALMVESGFELERAIEQLKGSHSHQLKTERENIIKPLEKQLKQAHTDSIEQIGYLEGCIAELKVDKDSLASDLTQINKQLEDANDVKHDLQQQIKKEAQTLAFTIWRSAVKIWSLKAAHEGTVNTLKRKTEGEEISKTKVLKDYHDSILAVMKLSNVLIGVEELRFRMLEVLRTYRVDDLNDKKIKIENLVRQLESLGGDKDSLEEQRDDVEEEIERLEEQVKEIEAESREHNRTSSTQDGRINVAHARKKKRLDEEFERLLQSIDHKRGIINDLDKQGAAKGRNRDDLERQLVDLERQLVEILVEQQKAVLGMIEQGRVADERSREVVKEIKMPWPPPLEPNANDVKQFLSPL